ncbi:MFS transporter [Bradymonas sediminis]|uniref:Uncharacterized protein n=1 Tax=Bradymonas sediminis TaxID=1548548 RepID=A0A2Z4FPU2_9DELT|nr:MFS transporter [Bradymonas sediminis]AWV90775.1 hypothetical protein DN745_16210 [Bradymonas sediminis]TDP75490.1 putative MFS family arabinose efflux permease [Bradymonas sediminis]
MNTKSPVLRLFPVLLVNLIGFAISIPVLPALAYALDGTATDVGFLYAIQALGQLLMAPIWGAISDRFGRKRTLIATFLTAAVFEVMTALTPALWLLYIVRFLVGMCAGNVATASALIADSTDPQSRSKGMAVIGISFGIGFTIGAGLGAWISTFGASGPGPLATGLPFAIGACIYVIAAIMGVFLLIEPTRDAAARRENRVKTGLASIAHHLKSRPVALMCGIFFSYSLAITIMEGTFFVYANEIYGWEQKQVGMSFAAFGLLMALVQGGIGRISKKIGDRRMVGIGVLLVGVGLTVTPFNHALWFLFVFLGLATVGRALVHPGILSMTSSLSPDPSQTGALMGVLQSFASLSRVVGPAIGGLIFVHISHGAPFWLSGVLLLVTGAWWWKAGRVLMARDSASVGR